MPTNVAGVHIDVTDQNRADGWSPGSSILVRIPDLDPARSRIPTVDRVPASLAANAPIVLWDATAKRRHAYWADLDANADPGAPRANPAYRLRPEFSGRRASSRSALVGRVPRCDHPQVDRLVEGQIGRAHV